MVGSEDAVMLARIFGAVAIGALVGLERTFHARPAGFRTRLEPRRLTPAGRSSL